MKMLDRFRDANERLNDSYFRRGEYLRQYQSLIATRLRKARIVLDLGAGSNDMSRLWEVDPNSIGGQRRVIAVDMDIEPGKLIIAVDMDLERLAPNPTKLRVVADAGALPFLDGSIDLVVTRSMFEHVEKPDAILSEASRILKTGSDLVFATPYKFSYISLVAAMTPLRFHIWAGRLQSPEANAMDRCVTLYRLNTVRDIKRSAQRAGLALSKCSTHLGDPNYTVFLPPPLHFLFIVFHKTVEQFNLTRRAFALNLVGVLEKS